MNNLTEIIEGVEKFAYEILIWVLLIPKTIIKIILNPGWVPEYVTRELEDKTDDRFDNFISPVILVLISTLVPIAFIYSTPYPGATISGPVEAYVHQPVRFVVDAAFIQQTKTYHYEWTADEQEKQIFDHQYLADYVVFTWNTPGKKQITAKADNGKGESYIPTFTVKIFGENEPMTASIDDGFYANRNSRQNFMQSLQEPVGLFVTFLFLTIPMLFALAIDILRGIPFSRRSFMRSFYIQSYYFSPLILSLWSLLLASAYFLDPKKETTLILLPLIAAFILILWLFVNEVRLVMRDKELNMVPAFLFTSTCFAFTFLLGYVYYEFVDSPEIFRKFLWITYGIGVAGLTGIAAVRFMIWVFRKFSRRPRG